MDKKTRESIDITKGDTLNYVKGAGSKKEYEALTHLITIAEKYEGLERVIEILNEEPTDDQFSMLLKENKQLQAKAEKYDKVVEGLEERIKPIVCKIHGQDCNVNDCSYKDDWTNELVKAIKSKLMKEEV